MEFIPRTDYTTGAWFLFRYFLENESETGMLSQIRFRYQQLVDTSQEIVNAAHVVAASQQMVWEIYHRNEFYSD